MSYHLVGCEKVIGRDEEEKLEEVQIPLIVRRRHFRENYTQSGWVQIMYEKPATEEVFMLESQEEGGFVATSPDYPRCVGQGETEEEAIQNLKEGIKLYLETPET